MQEVKLRAYNLVGQIRLKPKWKVNDLKGIELKTMKVQKEMLTGICAGSYKNEQDLECVENRVKWHISQRNM